ncbi:AzlD family protein [Pinisolibacter sp.]|uniref:AzlD family protein n=1 Tax=Pinisolibacter sp. TaxID=2172024 RepID=UPI002FDE31F9
MSDQTATLLAILGMAAVTFGCRISGLLLGPRFRPTGRLRAAFDAIPPAVLTAVIAPTVLVTGWPETLAAAATIVAAFRAPMLATIVTGVVAVVALRHGLG